MCGVHAACAIEFLKRKPRENCPPPWSQSLCEFCVQQLPASCLLASASLRAFLPPLLRGAFHLPAPPRCSAARAPFARTVPSGRRRRAARSAPARRVLPRASMRGASSAPQALAAAGGAGGVYVPLSTGSPMAAAGAGAAAQAPAPAAPLPASAPLSKYKVVFLGDSGAGKTSLIKTFIYGPGQFEANYSATIGIDFLAKVRAGAAPRPAVPLYLLCCPSAATRFRPASPHAHRPQSRARPFFSRTARCGYRFGTRRGRSASARSSRRTSATCVRRAVPAARVCASALVRAGANSSI